MVPTVSVHFRSHNPHRNELRLTIHYKRERFEIQGMTPDSTGLDLRREIERKIREKFGRFSFLDTKKYQTVGAYDRH